MIVTSLPVSCKGLQPAKTQRSYWRGLGRRSFRTCRVILWKWKRHRCASSARRRMGTMTLPLNATRYAAKKMLRLCQIMDFGAHAQCDYPYHLGCLDPPLDAVPPGEWFCPDCRSVPGEPVGQPKEMKATKNKGKGRAKSEDEEPGEDADDGEEKAGAKRKAAAPKGKTGESQGINGSYAWCLRGCACKVRRRKRRDAQVHYLFCMVVTVSCTYVYYLQGVSCLCMILSACQHQTIASSFRMQFRGVWL
jgi:hypothetical protein